MSKRPLWSMSERALPFDDEEDERARVVVGADDAPPVTVVQKDTDNGGSLMRGFLTAVAAGIVVTGIARLTAPKPATHVLVLVPPRRDEPTAERSE